MIDYFSCIGIKLSFGLLSFNNLKMRKIKFEIISKSEIGNQHFLNAKQIHLIPVIDELEYFNGKR